MSLKNRIIANLSNVKFTFHAMTRFQEDNLQVRKILSSFRDSFQVVEEYPDDPRGASALVLFFSENEPIHLVVAPHENELIIITGYRPNEREWQDNFSVRRLKS